MSSSATNAIVPPAKETPKQARVRIAESLGLDTTGTERELAQRIKDHKTQAKATDNSSSSTRPRAKKRKTNGGNIAVPSTRVTSRQDDGQSDSELVIDPSLTSLPNAGTATRPCEEERHQEDFMPQVQFNENESLQSQLDFLAHQAVADSRRAEPRASGPLYARHVEHYQNFIIKWSESRQAIPQDDLEEMDAEGTAHIPADTREIKPFPITADKAFFFASTEKKRGLGVNAIKQIISALEDRRKNEVHLWRDQDIPLLTTRLREYGPIQHLEEQSEFKEKDREGTIQSLKVSGSSLDVVSEANLKQCSLDFLNRPDSKGSAAFKVARDRAMLLVGTQTGYRGANIRALMWSDIRFKKIPVHELGVTQDGIAEVNSLTFWANCHKHNQLGKVEEVSMFRHRDPTLCSVYAVASYFFYYFHVYGCPRPAFAPDFDAPDAGKYGFREWFQVYLFFGHDRTKQMGYATHNNAYTKVFNACGIVTQKKTHATRVFMATNGRQNGAGESSVKSHGGWSAGSAFGASYAKHIPVDAIVAAAGFSGKDPSTYILTRDQIAVEPEMAEEIFPWIEDEEAALKSRQTRNPDCQDLALESFLQFLRWSRTVLLQDTAILMRTCSDLNILQFAPFNNPRFHRFAQSTYGIMEEFALGRQSLFQNLPAELRTGLVDVGASMKGELCQINARLSDFHEQSKEDQANLRKDVMTDVQSLVVFAVNSAVEQARSCFSEVLEQRLASWQHTRTSVEVSQVSTSTTMSPMQYQSFHFPSPGPHSLPSTSLSHPHGVDRAFPQATSERSSASHLPRTESDASPVTARIAIGPAVQSSTTTASTTTSITHTVAQWSDAQRIRKEEFVAEYPKLANHQWKFNTKQNEWYPTYLVKHCETVGDVWHEYANGVGGHAPVRLLEELFQHHWKFDSNSVSVTRSTRKRLTDLITAIAAQHPRLSETRACNLVRDELDGVILPLSKVLDKLKGNEGKERAKKVMEAARKWA